MPDNDIHTMSSQQLDDLDEVIQKERIRRYEERLIRETDELKKIGRERGYLVDEIFSDKRLSNAPKYRHPSDVSLTWSGRGRRPHWLNKALRDGATLEDLSVN